MKLSVSLPEEDVAFLDAYAAAEGFGSRSAALHSAVRLLRATQLGPAYEEAFSEWDQSGSAAGWETTAADGLGADASR
jgi:Arc/MetJ-type ribon-helix-helix transcriptional regulator